MKATNRRRWPQIMAGAALLALLAAGPARKPVPLRPQPGAPLDKAARELVARDLAEASRHGERPLLLVGSAVLGRRGSPPALFIQLQSARECGSAGCSTSVWLQRKGLWERALDGVAGEISVSERRTRGMADLLAGTTRYVWTGRRYEDPRPAPKINLRSRQPG